MTEKELTGLIDRAAELKAQEAEMAAERKQIEDRIAHIAMLDGDSNTVRVPGRRAIAVVQRKTKDTWDAPTCKSLAAVIGMYEFDRLFKVDFTGRKREITKYLAACDDKPTRDLLNSACKSEPARPYIKYEMIEEAAA